MQNLSAGAIRKPIPPIILFVLLTFAGLLGFAKLGINQYPDVDIPVFPCTTLHVEAALNRALS